MVDLDTLFVHLASSAFRSRFRLDAKDRAYFDDTGRAAVIEHARGFIADRLAPAHPANDGRQTPMRGHPVFVAQHATATCCRGCLEKWHAIPAGCALTGAEQAHVVAAITRWLDAEAHRIPNRGPPAARARGTRRALKATTSHQLELFGTVGDGKGRSNRN